MRNLRQRRENLILNLQISLGKENIPQQMNSTTPILITFISITQMLAYDLSKSLQSAHLFLDM
ncbi:CLUMA_CG003862, isoform A [Clunio marinus]|uniref:CLUMA_CG003862, isoform A n=1 Tax=Clunio marinus TaxID=568069 RepID=A0A1J1HRJ0_9DIPT|nr:CLUMA_CG003862, isoform A [Clunio marinus]